MSRQSRKNSWPRSAFSLWGVVLALVFCVAWGWSLTVRAQSAWDKKPEADITLAPNFPAFSPTAKLQPFWVNATSPYEFAIDAGSIVRLNEQAVHATLVITSSQGVKNVSIIGFRCDSSQRKLLAVARPDGSWSPSASSSWKEIAAGGLQNQAERNLASCLCLGSSTNSDPRDVLRRLAATFTESRH